MSDEKKPESKDECVVVTPIAVSVHRRKDNPIYGESATIVRVEDEAGGPFIVLISNSHRTESNEVAIDVDELIVIAREAQRLVDGVKDGWDE